jgi:RNA polymerase sporulation-specific sigma factor
MEIQQTDEQLVIKAQNGDKQAEETLLLRYRNLVRYCARKFFLVGGETEDLIQEGMMGLFQAVSAYKEKDGGARFKNFAYLCVSRRIIDAVKASARKKNVPISQCVPMVEADWAVSELNPEDMLILRDDRREFRQKMSRALSDFEFKVTSMYMDGMSCSEICEATGKSEKSIDNAIQRSKRKLQEILKG